MKVKYGKETDIIYSSLSVEPVKDSDESRPGIILDYSGEGSIVGIEILDASKKIPQPMKVEYEIG